MSLRRENIFDYISYIQNRLGIWDRKLTPDNLTLLQKIYEGFVNDLPKKDDYILTKKEVEKLNHSIISIVSKSKDDQESLEKSFKNWNKEYQKTKEDSIFKRLGMEDDIVVDPKSKESIILKSIAAVFFLISLYFIFVSIQPITFKRTPFVHSFEVTQTDSLTPVTFKVDTLIDFEYIKYVAHETFWLHKTDQSSIPIELDNGKLYCENSNFGSFQYMATSEENHSISLYVKTRKNFFGWVELQEIILKAVFQKAPPPPPPPSKGVFPKISFQDYPSPSRTLKALEESPKQDNTFIGSYKLPICLLFSLLVWWWLFMKNKKSARKKSKAKFGHPYFWRIELPNAPSIKLCEDVDKKVHLLRGKIPSGRNALNVPQTIRKTVKSGGFVTFQYAEESLKTEYLFLIGYKSQSDHMSKLWSEVALSLNAKDINTSVFRYNSDIRLCYSDQFPNGLSLKELYNHFSNSILVIIGEHYNFLNPFTGKLNNWLHVFENWSTRYLLTSKNYETWDNREVVLGKLFHVLPSKVSSLTWLQTNTDTDKEIKYKAKPYEHILDYNEEFTKSDVDISFTKVQKDWIAACCLFPNLHYDLSLAIGKLVFAHHNKDFSSTEIEEVFSLSWFSVGQIPDEIRTSLIEDFEIRNQELVDKTRSFIANEVKYHNPPYGSHASDWFREGILINELLNKSSQPSSRRREKIEKELNRIYKRGLESDIQLKPTVDSIKNPSLTSRLRHWFSRSKNILNLIATLASFIIPYIILTSLFHQKTCNSYFSDIAETVTLNNELSASFFTITDKAPETSEQVGLCKSELPDGESIYAENLLRANIILDKNYETHPVFRDSDFSSDVYNEDFRNNIAVDIYNKALQHSISLRGVSNADILQDEQSKTVASQFCEKIQQSKSLVNNPDYLKNFDFQDSLEISLRWCADNLDDIEKSIFMGVFGLSKKDVDYNKIINFLEKKSKTKVLELEKLDYSSSQSKVLYFDTNDFELAEDIAAELNILFAKDIVPEYSSLKRNNNNNFILYLIKPPSGREVNNVNVDPDCQSCITKLGFADTELPVFETKIQDIYVTEAGNNCQKQVTWNPPKVSDDCLRSLTSNKNSGDMFPSGEHNVTYTATDQCGNSSTYSFKIFVDCTQERPPTKEVYGIILDSKSGNPVSNAQVQVVTESKNKTTSNSIGEFTLNVLDKKTTFIAISKEGYATKSVPVSTFLMNGRVLLDPDIETKGIQIIGTIVDENGKSLPEVDLLRKDNSVLTTTNIRGNFSFNIPEKKGSFVVTHKGYDREVVNIFTSAVPITVTLKKTDSPSFDVITGTIVDASTEEPLIGASINMMGSAKGTVSGIDGNFSLSVPNKKGFIEGHYTGYRSISLNLENAKMPLVLRLEPGLGLDQVLLKNDLKLRGTVYAGKEPLVGANILIKGTTSGTITDLDGNFILNMPSTNETLKVSFKGYKSKEVKIGSKYWGKDRKQIRELNIKM